MFAFVDKEGIVSETGKYVDEMAVVDTHEAKVVLDLVHDSHVKKEEEIYAFENVNLYKENITLLRALGLALMCARNPKETDGEKQLREIFITDPALADSVKEDLGFHFHYALRQETEAQQDCICALAKLIGHTDMSYLNYE